MPKVILITRACVDAVSSKRFRLDGSSAVTFTFGMVGLNCSNDLLRKLFAPYHTG
jgi:hypothetical protein